MYNSKNFDIIQNSFDLNKNAHSYIFYTNDFLKCKNDLDILIKYIFNNDNIKSLENDLIIVNKSDKKNIQKEDVLKIKNLIFNTSYINKKRIYLIEEAEKINSTSSNMILKFLEEPPENVIGFFITTNLDTVISTIKSRCQIINAFYDSDISYEDEEVKILDDFFKKDKYIAIYEIKNYLKKYDRNNLIEIFNNYLNFLLKDIENKKKSVMIKKTNKVIKMLNNNVNVDYALDILFLEGDVK